MGLFKLRKNKRYSYSGRFNEEKLIDGSTHQNNRKIKTIYDEYRSTIVDNHSFRDNILLAINDYKKGSDFSVRKRLILIFTILTSLFLLFFFI